MRRTDNGTEPTAARAGRPPEDGLLPGPVPVRAAHRRRHRRSRRPGQPRRPRHRPAAGHLAGRPAAGTGLRPGPGPLRPDRSDQPGAEDPAAHPRPLRHLPRPRPGRPAHCATASPAAPTSARSARTSAPPATRSTAPTSCSPASTTGPGTAKRSPSRPGRRPTAPGIVALARRDPDSQTVTLVLDATTASIAIFAIAAHADEREAHLREVERFGQSLPEGSYGRRNRQAIAARETRIAARLRAVEHAYRTAIDRDAVFSPPEPTRPMVLPSMRPTRRLSWNRARSRSIGDSREWRVCQGRSSSFPGRAIAVRG